MSPQRWTQTPHNVSRGTNDCFLSTLRNLRGQLKAIIARNLRKIHICMVLKFELELNFSTIKTCILRSKIFQVGGNLRRQFAILMPVFIPRLPTLVQYSPVEEIFCRFLQPECLIRSNRIPPVRALVSDLNQLRFALLQLTSSSFSGPNCDRHPPFDRKYRLRRK